MRVEPLFVPVCRSGGMVTVRTFRRPDGRDTVLGFSAAWRLAAVLGEHPSVRLAEPALRRLALDTGRSLTVDPVLVRELPGRLVTPA